MKHTLLQIKTQKQIRKTGKTKKENMQTKKRDDKMETLKKLEDQHKSREISNFYQSGINSGNDINKGQ